MSNVKVGRNFITSLQGADPPHRMFACIPPLKKGPVFFFGILQILYMHAILMQMQSEES
jgi:hypothetical protein